MHEPSDPRLLIIGAHPDDAEYHAGGLAAIYSGLGYCVKMLSVTDGSAGHFSRPADELISLRRQESTRAGKVIGAVYETLGFPDGHLLPNLDVRHRIIREIREFRPDLVLTHRVCDYHPDHRATGQAVQDASYLVTVPLVLPEVPPLSRDPVFAYLADLFTRPVRLRADVVIDVGDYLDTIVEMLACHASQFFEWLPYHDGILESVPDDELHRREWLHNWYAKRSESVTDHFRDEIVSTFGIEAGRRIIYSEVYEISEYGSSVDAKRLTKLFPSGRSPSSPFAPSNGHLGRNGLMTNHERQHSG